MGKTTEVTFGMTVHGFNNQGMEYWVKAGQKKEVNEDETPIDVWKEAARETQSFLGQKLSSMQDELLPIDNNYR